MKSNLRTALFAIVIAGLPATAFAHGGGGTHGFTNGFGHPISGIDHLLAMVAVGMFAAYLSGRALWLVPATFALMMGVGGVLSIGGLPLSFVEIGIAASVIVLGLSVAMQWSLPAIAAMGLVGFFAIFHGYAHVAEMPVDASGLQYAMGFMLATALLHVVGIGVGLGTGRIGARASRNILQAGGGVMALAGVGILIGYF